MRILYSMESSGASLWIGAKRVQSVHEVRSRLERSEHSLLRVTRDDSDKRLLDVNRVGNCGREVATQRAMGTRTDSS